MEDDYRVINLYKTKQYDECIKLCHMTLQLRNDKMIEFIQMRVMSIQAKIAGNGYEEVDYFPQQEDFTSTAVSKTPRLGTSFIREAKTAQQTKVIIFLLLLISYF